MSVNVRIPSSKGLIVKNATQTATTIAWKNISNTYTAKFNEYLDCNTANSTFIVTLPSITNPTSRIGSRVTINDLSNTWETNNLIIDGNGKMIETGDRIVCDVSCQITLVFSGTIWTIR